MSLFPEAEPHDSALPKSELWLVEAAGHSAGEPAVEQAIVRAVRRFE